MKEMKARKLYLIALHSVLWPEVDRCGLCNVTMQFLL